MKFGPLAAEIDTVVWVAPTSAVAAFTVAGPTAWNSLPDYLRDPLLSEDTFRRLLKTYLFALY